MVCKIRVYSWHLQKSINMYQPAQSALADFGQYIEHICFFSVKDRINFDLSPKKKTKQIFCLFHAFDSFWEKLDQNPVQFFSVILRGVPLPHSNALQYYVNRETCTVNDVIFPSGCEARAINRDNKNMKIGIVTGGTSVRLKNIFTAISRYPTGKHEIILPT